MLVEPRRNQLLVSIFFVLFVSLGFVLAGRATCATIGESRAPGDRGHGNSGTQSAVADSGVDAGRLGASVAVTSVARCAPWVSVVKTPHGGIQPQAAVDNR